MTGPFIVHRKFCPQTDPVCATTSTEHRIYNPRSDRQPWTVGQQNIYHSSEFSSTHQPFQPLCFISLFINSSIHSSTDPPINSLVRLFVHLICLFRFIFLPYENRSHGHTQKLLLEDSDITSSEVPPSIERCQRNKPHPLHHHPKTQPNGNALSINSSSLKFQSNLDGTAGGELLWQEEGWTSGISAADAATVANSTGFEQHSSVQKNFGCISNRARNSFIDGILFTKQLAKEPALGNLIDFDSDGLSN